MNHGHPDVCMAIHTHVYMCSTQYYRKGDRLQYILVNVSVGVIGDIGHWRHGRVKRRRRGCWKGSRRRCGTRSSERRSVGLTCSFRCWLRVRLCRGSIRGFLCVFTGRHVAFRVKGQVVGSAETLPAIGTSERFVSGVFAHVPGKLVGSRETKFTFSQSTPVRLFTWCGWGWIS